MVAVFEVRKPKGQYNILLPAYFRQIFGVSWDIFYGLITITSFVLVTWLKIDENYHLLLLNSYFDMVVIFDALLSLFIRFYQSIQVVAVNRNIEALVIAIWNMLGFTLDCVSCLPYIFLLAFLNRKYVINAYQCICLLRLARLYTHGRQFLDKSLYEKVYSEIQQSDVRLPQLSLEDFGSFGPFEKQSTTAKKKLPKGHKNKYVAKASWYKFRLLKSTGCL